MVEIVPSVVLVKLPVRKLPIHGPTVSQLWNNVVLVEKMGVSTVDLLSSRWSEVSTTFQIGYRPSL